MIAGFSSNQVKGGHRPAISVPKAGRADPGAGIFFVRRRSANYSQPTEKQCFRNLFCCLARALHKERQLMKTNKSLNAAPKSTYALLVRSEENDRGLFETFLYGMLVLSAVIGIWQFAHLRVASPFAQTRTLATQVVSRS
jgi:hypothetical protein